MRYGLVLSLILAILAVIFALANPTTMQVDFLLFQTSGSTALILLLTFGLGVVVGLLSTLPKLLQTRRRLKKLEDRKGTGSSAPSPSSGTSRSESAT